MNFTKWVTGTLVTLLLVSCSQKNDEPVAQSQKIKNLANLSNIIAQKKSDYDQKAGRSGEHDHGDGLCKGHSDYPNEIFALERKFQQKRAEGSLAYVNGDNISIGQAMEGHTKIYAFEGKYKVMVIPVQFSDTDMVDKKFFKESAQDYIFGKNKNSLASYYKHVSGGKLEVQGQVTDIVTVDGTLADYGEAVTGGSDKNARGLVVDALLKLKEMHNDENWWYQYDEWDLNDYDNDKNFHEPDGFIDAVVLVYAGKSQASCQRTFDKDGTRPASADVPDGPQKESAVECFNRIWPHRWTINLSKDHPNFSAKGPEVEGTSRPSFGGLKITDELFALDYNMQSEFSDLSTFIHEFGHSLTLPDIYSRGKGNSTGQWEIMSSNSNLQAQEMSTYSKVSLGWVKPKVVKQGQKTSAYLGHYNFVANEQRENFVDFQGPLEVSGMVDGNLMNFSILSTTPGFGEPVYRSLAVITDPTAEQIKVVEDKFGADNTSAYTGRYDGDSRSLVLDLKVPSEGDANLTFDMIYHIETETNFNGNDPEIKVTIDYDIGRLMVNDKVLEDLRLVSGDYNYDTLNETNPKCEVERVIELRLKNINSELTEAEKKEIKDKAGVCQKPVWIEKSIDLSDYRGQTIEFKINYTTDAGYTEFGIVADNFKIGDQEINFEGDNSLVLDKWKELNGGEVTVRHQQFYLMEYRDTLTKFEDSGFPLSYNMDNNIMSTQSVFINEGENLKDQFRLLELNYQPGVVVWYFNSKYDRRSNDPSSQDGKGYYLVLNSKVQEMILPGGVFDQAINTNGEYADQDKDEEHKALVEDQRRKFACFGYTDYFVYQNGKAPECDDVDFVDYLTSLRKDGRKLVYRRERFNEILPSKRYNTYGVGQPFRTSAGIRTALSAFRPEGSKPIKPFKIYKEVDGDMVIDQALTDAQKFYTATSAFDDSKNKLPKTKKFQGDSVVVEKKGLNFRVVKPSKRITSRYTMDADPTENQHEFRAPQVKILLDWK